MNVQQRRGLILLVLSAVLAVTVFGGLALSRPPTATVYVLTDAADPTVDATKLKVRQVRIPRQAATARLVKDPQKMAGYRPAEELRAGTILQDGMLVRRLPVSCGQRAVTVLVDAEQSVARQVQPNDEVDIFATIPGSDPDHVDQAILIASKVPVLATEPVVTTSNNDSRQAVVTESRPITFRMDEKDGLRLTYAESFGKIRLALRNPADPEKVTTPGDSPGADDNSCSNPGGSDSSDGSSQVTISNIGAGS
jgi:Flp pilus assembly protein CpaB